MTLDASFVRPRQGLRPSDCVCVPVHAHTYANVHTCCYGACPSDWGAHCGAGVAGMLGGSLGMASALQRSHFSVPAGGLTLLMRRG